MHRRSSRSIDVEGSPIHPSRSRGALAHPESLEARRRSTSLERQAIAMRQSSLGRPARDKAGSSSDNSRSTESEKEKALVK